MSSSQKEGIGDPVESDIEIMQKEDYSLNNVNNYGENKQTEGIDNPVESNIAIIQKKDYSLNNVNNYGDNLLHLSAANGCHGVIKEIFKLHGCNDVNPKNDCGWTPLMQAIRNGNIETVKLLLANGCRPEESTSEDVSAIGLAAAMGLAMFEVVYNACPSALQYAKDDSISPLCVAAMKRDKELFFRLLELGLKVSDANEYTQLMMRQSRIPEIVKLAEARPDFEDAWDDSMEYLDFPDEDFEGPQMSSTLHIIESSLSSVLFDESKNVSENSVIPSIQIIPPSDKKNIYTRRSSEPLRINLLMSIDELGSTSSISPRLAYTREQTFPKSPDVCFIRRKENEDDRDFLAKDKIDNEKLHKYKMKRPPDLEISEDNARGPEYLSEDHKSNSSILCTNKTPIEPCYSTPPTGTILDADQTKMAALLKRFGLTHFIYTFIEQEVDLDLFLTLSDQDLQEIGIKTKSDRSIVLSVIDECNRYKI